MAKSPENKFRDSKLRPLLDKLPYCDYFIKEAAGLRGIADIIGCINGMYFALEVKKSVGDARKKTGRIVLQNYNIEKTKEKAKGYATLVYPENLDEVIEDLRSLGSKG